MAELPPGGSVSPDFLRCDPHQGSDEGPVRNKAVIVALGVRADGTKEFLGLWIEQSEGAKFWLRVMNELKTRVFEDVLIAIVDGLKGFDAGASAARI